tara:strand:+ start:1463 stop:1726 length:264 start_codon:yes stop_codon:yes gene_type:complete
MIDRIKFVRIENEDDMSGGRRLQTRWEVDDAEVIVSSVDNPMTCETMLFRVEGSDIDYFDLTCEKEYFPNVSQHAMFLIRFLEDSNV